VIQSACSGVGSPWHPLSQLLLGANGTGAYTIKVNYFTLAKQQIAGK
jgi:hypothetical protein